MYTESFHIKLKSARSEKGFSQEDVAEKLKISRNAVSQYETGKRCPDLETLGTLADLYEVSVDWLLGTKNLKKPYDGSKISSMRAKFSAEIGSI